MSGVVALANLPKDLGEQAQGGPSHPFAWQIDPWSYIDADRMGFDVRAIDRMIGAAGLSGVIVRGYDGENDSSEANPTGFSGVSVGGGATATGTATMVRAAVHQVSLESDDSLPYEYRRPIAVVGVNRTALGSRISDDVKAGMSKEQAWAKHYDLALRAGILAAAVQALWKEPLADMTTRQKWALSGITVVAGTSIGALLLPPYGWALGGGMLAIVDGLNNLDARQRMREDHPDDEPAGRKLSLFPMGVQLDRLAAVAWMAKTSHLLHPQK